MKPRFTLLLARVPVTARLYLLALSTIVVVAACQAVPLTSPTGSTISITADRDVLPLNGQATLRAVVIEAAGTPVQNGTVVNFTTTLGSVDPPEAKTINGIATTTLNAGSVSGTTTVHAFSGGARTGSGNSSGSGVTIKIGAAAAGSVAVSATPPSVSQSGGTVTISALVMDPANNPLPGVQVVFSSTTGTLGSTAAISDANGVAKTTLTTSQTATVTATANGTAKGTVDVIVSVAPAISISGPDTGTVGVPVAFTFTPQGGSGNSSPRQIASLVVDFGDGSQPQRLTNITGSTGVTHTYTRDGGYTVTATADDVTGNTSIASKGIVIQRQQQPTVTLSAPASTNVSAPIQVSFSGDTKAPGAQITSARVTLGDGTVIFSGTQPNNFNYKFSSPGTYTLIGTVTDSNGNTATTSTTVFVSG